MLDFKFDYGSKTDGSNTMPFQYQIYNYTCMFGSYEKNKLEATDGPECLGTPVCLAIQVWTQLPRSCNNDKYGKDYITFFISSKPVSIAGIIKR